jgi:chemotaxis protein MotB
MAGHRGKRRRGGGHDANHPDERWLVSYADMVTLLMALFIVMFAMANVNTSKFKELKKSLANAFSGPVKTGGGSILDGGASDKAVQGAIVNQVGGQSVSSTGPSAGQQEAEQLQKLKERVDAYAREKGLADKLSARVERRGLVITILTDQLLFDSGSAQLKSQGLPLMNAVAGLLRQEKTHQVVVEGHTDTVPISGSQYPTNWELSTARASTVVRVLAQEGVNSQRLTAAGRAYLDPVASNSTDTGRSQNRRVQIVLPRQAASPTSDDAEPKIGPSEPEIGPSP